MNVSETILIIWNFIFAQYAIARERLTLFCFYVPVEWMLTLLLILGNLLEKFELNFSWMIVDLVRPKKKKTTKFKRPNLMSFHTSGQTIVKNRQCYSHVTRLGNWWNVFSSIWVFSIFGDFQIFMCVLRTVRNKTTTKLANIYNK